MTAEEYIRECIKKDDPVRLSHVEHLTGLRDAALSLFVRKVLATAPPPTTNTVKANTDQFGWPKVIERKPNLCNADYCKRMRNRKLLMSIGREAA